MKKKGMLIIAIIWSLIAVAIIVILVLGLTGKLQKPAFLKNVYFGVSTSSELVKEESFDISSLDTLSIATGSYSVEIVPVSGNAVRVRQYDKDSEYLFESAQSGSELRVSMPSRTRVFIGFFFGSNNRLEIGVPTDFRGDLNLESKSGSVSLRGLNCDNLNVETGSGSMNLEMLNLGGDIRVVSGSGSQRLDRVVCECFEIRAGSGSLRIDELRGYGSIDTGSGSISAEDLQLIGDSSVSTGSGSVKLGFEDRTNLFLRLSSGSGSIRAEDVKLYYTAENRHEAEGTLGTGADGTLTVRTGSGSIRIDD
jgi:DUF4097 and DUF4098 domain-containing protein YvlB